MSKKAKIWSIIAAVVTGGVAIGIYSMSPLSEAALSQN